MRMLVCQRSVEAVGKMRAVAERLVIGAAAATERHLVGVRDLAPIDIGEFYVARDEIRAVNARRDGDVSHKEVPSLDDWYSF